MEKFDTLTREIIEPEVRNRFIDSAQRLPQLGNPELGDLTPTLAKGTVKPLRPTGKGIFDHR